MLCSGLCDQLLIGLNASENKRNTEQKAWDFYKQIVPQKFGWFLEELTHLETF